MRLDLTGREPLRIQADHIARQPVQTTPVLGHRGRLERARPVTRHREVDLADLGRHPLGGRPVAQVRRPAALRGVTLIAQMLGHLDLQTGLEHPTHQTGQQAIVAGQLHALSARLSHQLLSPVLHRRLARSIARRHSRPVMISHRHDPPQPTAQSCGPSDHARYTKFPTVPAAPLKTEMCPGVLLGFRRSCCRILGGGPLRQRGYPARSAVAAGRRVDCLAAADRLAGAALPECQAAARVPAGCRRGFVGLTFGAARRCAGRRLVSPG